MFAENRYFNLLWVIYTVNTLYLENKIYTFELVGKPKIINKPRLSMQYYYLRQLLNRLRSLSDKKFNMENEYVFMKINKSIYGNEYVCMNTYI